MKKHLFLMLSLIFLGLVFGLTACESGESSQPTTVSPETTQEEIIITPTPRSTATPSALEKSVADVSATTGLDSTVFLGLTGEDWINLGISVLIFI